MPTFSKNKKNNTTTICYANKTIKTVPSSIIVDNKHYEFLSSGNYNIVYRSDDKKSVYKQPSSDAFTEDAQRAVRLWNEINPSHGSAHVSSNKKGWIAPFVEGDIPTDAEIANAILSIYQNTGRIVVDGCCFENFVKTRSGKVVCIDISFALLLETNVQRRTSKVSQDFWINGTPEIVPMKHVYSDFFKQHANEFPQSITTIKALLCLRENNISPDLNAIRQFSSLRDMFSERYDNHLKMNNETVLLQIQLIKRLQHYIDNAHQGRFIGTGFLRNSLLTDLKIESAGTLIAGILQSNSIHEIYLKIANNLSSIKERVFYPPKSSSTFSNLFHCTSRYHQCILDILKMLPPEVRISNDDLEREDRFKVCV